MHLTYVFRNFSSDGKTKVLDLGCGTGTHLNILENVGKILLESFEHMGEGRTVYESLVNKFEYIQMEQLFFRAAFKNDQQNCLRDHDFELIQEFYTKQIESRTGRKISTELQFELEMYCLGSVYMTVQWCYLMWGFKRCTRGNRPEKSEDQP